MMLSFKLRKGTVLWIAALMSLAAGNLWIAHGQSYSRDDLVNYHQGLEAQRMASVLPSIQDTRLHVLQNVEILKHAPYPPSPVIKRITWDFDAIRRGAPGSDLWPLTWGPGDAIYTAWGDGGGFGGDNYKGRVSLGIARLTGSAINYTAVNVNGGVKPISGNSSWSCLNCGKPLSILAINSTLYMWVYTQEPTTTIRLYWSTNSGSTWASSSWSFPEDNFAPFGFLQYGQNYKDAPDCYVYVYGTAWSGGKNLYLARVNQIQVKNRRYYEFYKGVDPQGNPLWTKNIQQREAIFSDRNGVSGSHVVYNKGIKRYILTTGHRGKNGNWGAGRLGMFDAPKPWGPWTTITYEDNWNNLGTLVELGWHIANKWTSGDGKTIWVVYSADDSYDRFNLIKATLSIANPEAVATPAPKPFRRLQSTPGTHLLAGWR